MESDLLSNRRSYHFASLFLLNILVIESFILGNTSKSNLERDWLAISDSATDFTFVTFLRLKKH